MERLEAVRIATTVVLVVVPSVVLPPSRTNPPPLDLPDLHTQKNTVPAIPTKTNARAAIPRASS